MTPIDPLYHTAPLTHLVKHTIHKGKPLEELVRKLRYKRRKPKQQVASTPNMCEHGNVFTACSKCEGHP